MLWRAFALILILVFFGLVISSLRGTATLESGETTSTAQAAAPILAITAVTGEFNKTGTLVFYPNNVGPVPYLFYIDEKGRTVAKALVFDNLPRTDFSVWTGARVFVVGTLYREHVVVRQITHLSPP